MNLTVTLHTVIFSQTSLFLFIKKHNIYLVYTKDFFGKILALKHQFFKWMVFCFFFLISSSQLTGFRERF